MKIGIAGTGRMGTAIAQRLLELGHEVRVWNRTFDKAHDAREEPLLGQLCGRVEHVGPLGAGARMKLAANLLLAVFWQALGESLLLVDPSAMDAARAIDLLADSNIGAAILRMRAPQIVAAM